MAANLEQGESVLGLQGERFQQRGHRLCFFAIDSDLFEVLGGAQGPAVQDQGGLHLPHQGRLPGAPRGAQRPQVPAGRQAQGCPGQQG